MNARALVPTPETTAETVLIVDDTPTNIKVLFDCLREAGYRVLVASDGESAIGKASKVLPDAILLDVMMPGIDGFETCRRLKQLEATRPIPVIFMTALADTAHKVEGLTIGGVDYLTKPIQIEDALARLRVHLQLRREIRDREAAEAALRDLNAQLEQKVAERTAELADSLQQLQQAQVQLVQGEKMASLGQLVAGIAHEINNPVNFIHGNLMHAEEYVRDLLEALSAYRDRVPSPDEDLEALLEELEVDYLSEDLPALVQSMRTGTDRIRDIVISLRNFSRLDEAELKRVNLHDGIESTLTILGYRLKAKGDRPAITIERAYGDLPEVECYAGPLNQVFMNLLVNAIDALEEYNRTRNYATIASDPNRILVRTERLDGDWIRVAICDNGPGIPEAVKAKIFDPFYTTKEVGKGTGMGLAISRQIVVDRHHGRLTCHSEAGQGTTFAVELPLRASTEIAPETDAADAVAAV